MKIVEADLLNLNRLMNVIRRKTQRAMSLSGLRLAALMSLIVGLLLVLSMSVRAEGGLGGTGIHDDPGGGIGGTGVRSESNPVERPVRPERPPSVERIERPERPSRPESIEIMGDGLTTDMPETPPSR